MKLPKGIPTKIWLVALSGFIIFNLSYFRGLNNFENICYDFILNLRPALKGSSEVLLIEISDDTLNNLGKWPLPRDFHASLIDVLREAGARMIIFDVLFSEGTLYDEAFA